MVTGREIEELKEIFSRLDLFEVIVGENGALLYYPHANRIKALHAAPPSSFAEMLRARGVMPLSIGHVIVATYEPNEFVALEVIKSLGLELEIIFNKGSVMILPTGVSKATGFSAALKELGIPCEHAVGVGDAENDHAFLSCCGCGVAVSNALSALKDHADYVTRAPHGPGVIELIDLLLATDLEAVPPGDVERTNCLMVDR